MDLKGLVTEVLEDLVVNQHKQYDHCVVIGPMIMMKICLYDDETPGDSDDSQRTRLW